MRNQFFYTIPGTERFASFNVEKVIRSMDIEDGSTIVILDDFHTENRQTIVHNQNGKPIPKVESVVLQSEIVLSSVDGIRFKNQTHIYEVPVSNLVPVE